MTRMTLACAVLRHAWTCDPEARLRPPAALRHGQHTPGEVAWIRALWLLCRTLCGAFGKVGG
jgi:hypothetical protein